MPKLVGERNRRVMRVEMPRRGRQISRLHRITRQELNDVQALAEAYQIAVVLETTGPASTVKIGDIGRARDRTEVEIVSAGGEIVLGISRVKREFGGCLGNVIEHKIARKAHTLRAWRDFGARGFKNAERFFIEEIHADFFQHLEGRIVDRLDLVGTENLNRLVRILIASPRRLLD